MLYTVVNIPYGALAGVMTTHTDDRTKLNSARGNRHADRYYDCQLCLTAFVISVFGKFGTAYRKQLYTGDPDLCSCFCSDVLSCVQKLKRSDHTNVSKEKVSIKDSLKVIATNKYLAIVIAVSLISMVAYMGSYGYHGILC